MGWKPVHEAHAIDRVRILVQFNNPLTDKLLAKAALPATSRFQELGFDELVRAETATQSIMISVQPATAVPSVVHNGWLLKRSSSGMLVEEAGFRDGVFGYMSTEYGRWENLARRFWDLFEAPLGIAFDSVDVSSLRLEYWDRFVFDGDVKDANARDLLSEVDPALPKDVIEGASLWHSHAGWFEKHKDDQVLVNRNIDVLDEGAGSDKRRVCNVFTLFELRPVSSTGGIAETKDALEHLHRRSLTLFGTTLSEAQRTNIGLNLTDYVE
jgi:uncharacterized protein (TIGR04255 family)